MNDYKRSFDEAVAIAKLEPGLKNIYVEGVSDRFLIKNFFDYHKICDVTVFNIDSIDFSEYYDKIGQELAYPYRSSNKQRVVLLAHTIEKETHDNENRTLCIIDVDWDYVLNKVYTGRYLSYTDYNSMEMYLFDRDIVKKYLQEGHRIADVKEKNLLNSLSVLCRQVFHIHCLLHERGKQMLDNDKSFSFDKKTQTCSIDLDTYFDAVLNKNNLMANKADIKREFSERMAKPFDDVRNEIRGHDFVYYLFLCAKKMKTKKMDMNSDEFANLFWRFANYEKMVEEPVFRKILSL